MTRVRFGDDDDISESLVQSSERVTFVEPPTPEPIEYNLDLTVAPIAGAAPAPQSGAPQWLTDLMMFSLAALPKGKEIAPGVEIDTSRNIPSFKPFAEQVIKNQVMGSMGMTPKKAAIGAEPGGSGGWTPQQISGASQKQLRLFYGLEKAEQDWIARAIVKDNPRLYGHENPNYSGPPKGTSGGGTGYGTPPYNIESGGGGWGGGGGGYAARVPEWYLNMISWRI